MAKPTANCAFNQWIVSMYPAADTPAGCRRNAKATFGCLVRSLGPLFLVFLVYMLRKSPGTFADFAQSIALWVGNSCQL